MSDQVELHQHPEELREQEQQSSEPHSEEQVGEQRQLDVGNQREEAEELGEKEQNQMEATYRAEQQQVNGKQDEFARLRINLPERIKIVQEASGLLKQAYLIEQESRILKSWADRQLKDATITALYTGRQLEMAEEQLKNTIDFVESHGYEAFNPHPIGIISLPYVAEVKNAVHKISIHGGNPTTVLTYFN